MTASFTRNSLSSFCKTYPTPSIVVRSFSTTTSLSKIGPESPRFIEVPQPPQQKQVNPRDVKGILPPPRNLFPSRGADKTAPEYFSLSAPEPSSQRHLSEPKNDYISWKRKLAETRRTNLKEGLLALHRRKIQQQEMIASKSSAKRASRERRLNAPKREDVRLTSPTIRALNSTLQKGRLPDPQREERLKEMAAKVRVKELARETARKNALHTLYMHARHFITTEEELGAKINEIFVPNPWQAISDSDNIWEAQGPPPTVQEMLSTVNKSQKTAVEFHKGDAVSSGERIQRIAEELTGGKMD
ncbi:hypothetical protein PVAG01_07812 [Phlyctema vagabunda]|uniref:Uncharacterized protein n=1 Tax=Phlyctema vagabunda TaxID=108571 RepID=A0ABR4PDI8_9HELO